MLTLNLHTGAMQRGSEVNISSNKMFVAAPGLEFFFFCLAGKTTFGHSSQPSDTWSVLGQIFSVSNTFSFLRFPFVLVFHHFCFNSR